MKGGTYAEALKAGFNEQRASYFGRMSSDTSAETVEYLDKREADRVAHRREEFKKSWSYVLALFGLFLCGRLFGSLITQLAFK